MGVICNTIYTAKRKESIGERERDERVMEGKKPSLTDELSAKTSAPSQSWEEERISSPSELFDQLNKMSLNRAQLQTQKELSSSEFLELLGKQSPKGDPRKSRSTVADCFSQGGSKKYQTTDSEDGNQDYQNAAIDQCSITSAVDYGSRDYYYPSTDTSETRYASKEQELDEYKSGTDSRGNWWEGSLYY